MIKAPWPVLALVAAIIAAFAWEQGPAPPEVVEHYLISSAALREGRYGALVGSLFLHGGWAHALGNAAFALAFATPVCRRMGRDARGVVSFFVFYLLCGVISGLTFALAHWHDAAQAAGASGAIAGCMGAASRLMGPGPGLAPFRSSPVVSMAVAWLVANVLFGLIFVGWAPGAGGAGMAWEAHLGGYVAGLFLIGPALRLIGRA
ncbi:MAG: rhomboid family intramembrane serine protease [Caulobacteraceae bacterium]|nr:rhomboid family intramembrane serine protease [Caulobacteraceae bacterium]